MDARRTERRLVTDARVRVCPEGPILVRGAAVVVDEEGVAHAPARPVVAVCGCGKSARKPWCDSTHKSVPGTSPVASG